MPNQHRYKYTYEGPVMLFNACIDPHWSAVTYAPTEKKARNNLAYRYKKETGKAAGSNITLPGKLTKEV